MRIYLRLSKLKNQQFYVKTDVTSNYVYRGIWGEHTFLTMKSAEKHFLFQIYSFFFFL